MSRVDELERYNRINHIMDELLTRSDSLKKQLGELRLDLADIKFSTDNVDEKRALIASRLLSIMDEVKMMEAEMKYRNATANWIKANLPES